MEKKKSVEKNNINPRIVIKRTLFLIIFVIILFAICHFLGFKYLADGEDLPGPTMNGIPIPVGLIAHTCHIGIYNKNLALELPLFTFSATPYKQCPDSF